MVQAIQYKRSKYSDHCSSTTIISNFRLEVVDVFLCGYTVEKAIESMVSGQNATDSPHPGGHSQNAVGSITYDWDGYRNVQVLRGPRDTGGLQDKNFAMQLRFPGHIPGLPRPFPGLRRHRDGLRNGFLGILLRRWWPARLLPKTRRIHGRLLPSKPAHAG